MLSETVALRALKLVVLAAMVATLWSGTVASPVSATQSTTATQSVVTLDLHSRYLSYTQAVVGLTGTTKQEAGPTGLRTWVVLPAGYSASRCWPVLYLLHAADTVREWLDVASVYSGLHAVVVIPGGGNGQTSNWWNDGARTPAWESWFNNELIPMVGKHFAICPSRRDHAIAGSSMGGYEAMFVASQDPAYFGTAASFSGPISLTDPVIEDNFNEYTNIWGPIGGFYAIGHDPVSLLRNLVHTRLFVYVGNGTPVDPKDVDDGDEALIETVMEREASDFVSAARHDRIRVHYLQHTGIHDQLNWNISLADFIRSNPFSPVATSPRSWTYTTVAQTSQAWGYSFRFTRPPATLERFSLKLGSVIAAGSGAVSVSEPGGGHFTATMPFVLRGGKVRSGNASAPSVPVASGPTAQVSIFPFSVHPRSALLVHFTPSARLRPGKEYELDALESDNLCIVNRTVFFDPTHVFKSYTVRITAGGGAGHPDGRWCRGSGDVAVEIVSRQSSGIRVGEVLGRGPFRIR